MFEVAESSRVGEARRAAMALARELGFSATEVAEVGIVVTEAATNLLKHARSGVLLIRALDHGQYRGVEILAVDQGNGIADIESCLRDGCSTVAQPSQEGIRTWAFFALFWPRAHGFFQALHLSTTEIVTKSDGSHLVFIWRFVTHSGYVRPQNQPPLQG